MKTQEEKKYNELTLKIKLNNNSLLSKDFRVDNMNKRISRSEYMYDYIYGIHSILESELKRRADNILWGRFNPYEEDNRLDTTRLNRDINQYVIEVVNGNRVIAAISLDGSVYQEKAIIDTDYDFLSKKMIHLLQTNLSK